MTLRRILVCLMTIGGCATMDGLSANGGKCPADTATYIEQPTENTK